MKNTILAIFLLHFVCIGFSQEKVIGIIPIKHSISKSNLSEAQTLTDINQKFPEDWVREYISVNITAVCNGVSKSAKGSDFNLSKEQKSILKLADTGSEIQILVTYYPDNNLPKEVKEFDFDYIITPDIEAEFDGGKTALQAYLKENILQKLSTISDSDIFQARVRFNIDENGNICAVHQLEQSHSTAVNNLIIKTINEMPKWTPAKNADGTNVTQVSEFILTGDLCLYGYLSEGE